MIRKIGWAGSHSWKGTVDMPWGSLDSESWAAIKSGSGVWNLDLGLSKCWSSCWCWCWVWSKKIRVIAPRSNSWGDNK